MNRGWAGLLALASLVVPGLGHALAASPRRAVAIALGNLVAQLAFALIQGAERLTPMLLALALAFLAAMLCAVLWVAIDSWRQARAAPPGGWRARGVLAGAVLALGLGLALVPGETVAWRSYSTPSGSMIPTLRIGDRFIAQQGWYDTHPVRRGEVVVFELAPDGPAYVKRVVGLAGDRVRMVAGRLVLNGTEVAVTPAGPDPAMEGEGDTAARREIWALPDGPRVEVMRLPGYSPGADTATFDVPAAHVFVMGDNVENSADSRIDARMRYVPAAALVGRAAIVYWPWTGGRFGKGMQ